MGLDLEKLKAARLRTGMTMQQAAEAMGIKASAAKTQWYQIEAGVRANPSLETLESLCRVLRVSIADLLTDDSPAMPKRRARTAKQTDDLIPDTNSEKDFDAVMRNSKHRRTADRLVKSATARPAPQDQ